MGLVMILISGVRGLHLVAEPSHWPLWQFEGRTTRLSSLYWWNAGRVLALVLALMLMLTLSQTLGLALVLMLALVVSLMLVLVLVLSLLYSMVCCRGERRGDGGRGRCYRCRC